MAIHIKKSHRGRFTAYKKRTGKTTAEALHSKNPHVRQMANFARNARKWKHELGGELPKYGGMVTNTTGPFMRDATTSFLPSGERNQLDLSGLSGLGSGLVDMFATPDDISYRNKVNLNEGAAGLKGALSGAAAGMMLGPIGAGVGALVGGLGSLFGTKVKERRMQKDLDEQLAKKQFSKDVSTRFSTMSESPTYTPVAKQGGFTVYKGETHDGPTGGILTDEQGNPTGLSNNKPIALTEKNEVSRFNPKTGSTYIYSDSLGFAKPATRLVNKYKLNKKDNILYKNDQLLQAAVDRQFDNLMTAQEFSRETKTKAEESLGMFKKGGQLTSWKARKMLRDNSAQGHPLTARQKRYFGWIAGGRKQEGGELIDIRDKRTLDMVTGEPLQNTRRFNAKVDSDYIKSITESARKYKVDPYTALAINLGETRFDPNEMHNPFRLGNYNPQGDVLDESMRFMADKGKYARKLGKTSEEDIIQAWNGYGTIKNQGRMYGMDTNTTPLNMNINPVYGKRIVNLRDSVIRQNPQIVDIVEGMKKSGGYIKKKKKYMHGTAAYPFLPEVAAPIGAYSHSAVKYGGYLPEYQDGDQLATARKKDLGKINMFIKRLLTPLMNVLPQDPNSVGAQALSGAASGNTGTFFPNVVGDNVGQTSAISTNRPATLEIPRGPVFRKPTGGTGAGTPRLPSWDINPIDTEGINMNAIDYYNEPWTLNNGLAKGPTMPTGIQEDTTGRGWLNPAGHILSGAGSLADYFAMKKAKPTNVSLGRVGAERINLAKQRLANIRNAASARSMNTAGARSMGMNAGVAMSNISAANTGVNRLLGQQNAELLEKEETTNAQMRQQANMVNAELAAQEGLFNTQQQNAYRMMMAQRNPLGNLARTAAGYFADNAAYQQGYDTLQMLAPNAELYQEPDTGWLKKTFGRPRVRLRDKTL